MADITGAVPLLLHSADLSATSDSQSSPPLGLLIVDNLLPDQARVRGVVGASALARPRRQVRAFPSLARLGGDALREQADSESDRCFPLVPRRRIAQTLTIQLRQPRLDFRPGL
jgi:hypothetical protein